MKNKSNTATKINRNNKYQIFYKFVKAIAEKLSTRRLHNIWKISKNIYSTCIDIMAQRRHHLLLTLT